MSKLYRPASSRSPSLHANSYVYTIAPIVDHGVAAITSADELILLDRQNLATSPILRLANIPQKVSCLIPGSGAGDHVLCSGADGSVATFDVRSQNRASHFKTDRAVTALACRDNYVALGTEFASQQAVVSVWDRRNNQKVWQNSENNDDITALDFHPSRNNILLAGGDDGQVSIFDTTIADEDDSLLQGVNHGPIHKAGFLGDGRFFALSSDQNLSVHPVSSQDDAEDPLPIPLGDLRTAIPCEYVIDVFQSGDGYVVAAGSNNSDPRVNVVELRHATNLNKDPKIKSKSGYILDGAHGEEIVRSLFADTTTGIFYTAGEDGQIKAFSMAETIPSSTVKSSSSKPKQGAEARYKPY